MFRVQQEDNSAIFAERRDANIYIVFMGKDRESNHPAATLALYDALVRTIPDLQRKGATIPYTSLNGHMFSYLSKEGSLALRLPKDSLERFLKEYKTTLHAAYGIVQKEYATVPESLFKNTKALKKYFLESYTYVQSLKPKPSTKSKSKK